MKFPSVSELAGLGFASHTSSRVHCTNVLRQAVQIVLVVALLMLDVVAQADTIYAGSAGTPFISPSIVKFNSDGLPTVFTNTNINNPRGMAFDESGNLYVVNLNDGTIYKFDPNGVPSFFADTLMVVPMGMARDSKGNFYVADSRLNFIEKFSSTGVDLGVFASTGLNIPVGLAVDAGGNIYAANAGDNTIAKFSATGALSIFASTGMSEPSDLAFDSNGLLFVSNHGNKTIVKFSPSGIPTLFANTALFDPLGLAFDSADNLYVIDGSTNIGGSNTIHKFTPTGRPSVFANTGLFGSQFIAVKRDGACVSPPNTTMVAWYPFDEVTGTLSANHATGNTGVQINEPTPIPGMVAGALRFNGVNQYVESPSSIVTNIGPADLPESCIGGYSSCRGDFSIDTWIRVEFDPFGESITTILDKRGGSAPAIKGYHFFVFLGSLGLQLADGLGSGYSNYLSPELSPALTDGNWHHIAVTVRRTMSAGIRWYHNSVLVGISDPTDRLGSLGNNSPLRIGTRTADSPLTGWFLGDLDELEIFNRALTPEEVASIFNAGSSGKCK